MIAIPRLTDRPFLGLSIPKLRIDCYPQIDRSPFFRVISPFSFQKPSSGSFLCPFGALPLFCPALPLFCSAFCCACTLHGRTRCSYLCIQGIWMHTNACKLLLFVVSSFFTLLLHSWYVHRYHSSLQLLCSMLPCLESLQTLPLGM